MLIIHLPNVGDFLSFQQAPDADFRALRTKKETRK